MKKKTKKRAEIKPIYPNLVPTLPKYSPKNLGRLRKRLYLSQVQAAYLVRVSPQTFRNWESGRREMPLPIWAYFLEQYKRVRRELKENFKQMGLADL